MLAWLRGTVLNPSADPMASAHFVSAKQAWIDQHKSQPCGRCCSRQVPADFMRIEPDACPGRALTPLGGDPTRDGVWPVCLGDPALKKSGCVAYLVGAGSDISFDFEFAMRTKCTVVTVDPTPGLRDRFAAPNGALSMVAKDLTRLNNSGPPANWQHANFGLGKKEHEETWHGGWSNGHVKWLNRTVGQRIAAAVDTHVKFLPMHGLMQRLGHSHVDFVKLDIEGGEWDAKGGGRPLYEEIIYASGATHVAIEVHSGYGHNQWFAFLGFMRAQGFTPLFKNPVRYLQGRKSDQFFTSEGRNKLLRSTPSSATWSPSSFKRERRPFRWRHVRMTNYTLCNGALGELYFYRSHSLVRNASWKYVRPQSLADFENGFA